MHSGVAPPCEHHVPRLGEVGARAGPLDDVERGPVPGLTVAAGRVAHLATAPFLNQREV